MLVEANSLRNINQFKDILHPRRKEWSNLMYMSRSINNIVAPYSDIVKLTPRQLKNETLKSRIIYHLIEKLKIEDLSLQDAMHQIKMILDEIGFKKNYNVIRWFGVVVIKFCLNITNGLYVNDVAILKIRKNMGKVPIVYVPSHRSYADFILMSYICFNYDIEIPAIAAGMDFHAMWGMGTLLRDTGAFFMRRSFNKDTTYWDTFQEYVYTVISKGQLGIEFFIEGTRSRTGKSLTPKIGLLSMILKAYFKSDVPDILFVPINFSYDRVLEENLFAFELLGVPKPKESTSGFFKSFRLMKENFGSIYVDFAEPISVHEFFVDKTDKQLHNMKPKFLTFMTDNEKAALQMFAQKILQNQRRYCTLSLFNLIALILMDNLISENESLTIDLLKEEIAWINNILEKLGALTTVQNINSELQEALKTHKNLVTVNRENMVHLVQNKILIGNIDTSKLKAHSLNENTMTLCVPFFMLQIYVNNTLHYFANGSIMCLSLNSHRNINISELKGHFTFLRGLFGKEFVFSTYDEDQEFNEHLQKMLNLQAITETDGQFRLGPDKKFSNFIVKLLDPFVLSYYMVLMYLKEANVTNCVDRDILIWCQIKLEQALIRGARCIHPYSLCLDTLTNCIQSLIVIGVLHKNMQESNNFMQLNKDKLYNLMNKFETYLPSTYTDNLYLLISSSKL